MEKLRAILQRRYILCVLAKGQQERTSTTEPLSPFLLTTVQNPLSTICISFDIAVESDPTQKKVTTIAKEEQEEEKNEDVARPRRATAGVDALRLWGAAL
jgi:hypothetical protein